MTQDELDALPDDSPRFGTVERVINGETYRVPYLEPDAGILWTEHDEPNMVRDVHGDYWRVGKGRDGRMYKRRMA